MPTFVTRLTAWTAIALTALAVIAAEAVPSVHAGLADAMSLCTPDEVALAGAPRTHEPCPGEATPLRVPRCGVV